MSESIVQLCEVSKSLGGRVVLDRVDLEVEGGEFLSLLGPSGCGKTTTLRLIAGVDQPDSGTVTIGGQLANGSPPYKRDVNTVFQNYALFPKEGALRFIDNWAIPRGAPNRDLAERFINFTMIPEAAARNVNEVRYASPITGAAQHIDPDILKSWAYLMPEGIRYWVSRIWATPSSNTTGSGRA